MADFDREYNTEKWCAPTCTLQCVHQVGISTTGATRKGTRPDKSWGSLKDTIQEVLSAE